MTREQALNYMRSSGWSEEQINTVTEAFTCEDAISRQAAIDLLDENDPMLRTREYYRKMIAELPSITPQQKVGRCKDCKFFDLDSVYVLNDVPLIPAHEICRMWGMGCKTRADGYCHMFDKKMEEVEE